MIPMKSPTTPFAAHMDLLIRQPLETGTGQIVLSFSSMGGPRPQGSSWEILYVDLLSFEFSEPMKAISTLRFVGPLRGLCVESEVFDVDSQGVSQLRTVSQVGPRVLFERGDCLNRELDFSASSA